MKTRNLERIVFSAIALLMLLSVVNNIGSAPDRSRNSFAALGSGINLISPWNSYRADALSPFPQDSLKEWKLEELEVEDNQLMARYKDRQSGKPHSVEMTVRDGQVRALVIDGRVIPEDQFDRHQALIDMTLQDVQMVREEMTQARQGLEDFDEEEIRIHMERSLEDLDFPEPPVVHFDFDFDSFDLNIPEMDSSFMKMHIEPALRAVEDIDWEEIEIQHKKALQKSQEDREAMKMEKGLSKREKKEIRREIEAAQIEMQESMQQVMEEIDWEEIREAQRKAMEEIDWEAIREEQRQAMEEARQAMEEAFKNQEEIRQAMEEARHAWEEIDHEAIREEIRRSMENLEFEKLHIEEEMQKLEKQLQEIDKLGLEKK